LLLLQASDWPFVIARDQAVDYGIKRFMRTPGVRVSGRRRRELAHAAATSTQLSELERFEIHDSEIHDVCSGHRSELVEGLTATVSAARPVWKPAERRASWRYATDWTNLPATLRPGNPRSTRYFRISSTALEESAATRSRFRSLPTLPRRPVRNHGPPVAHQRSYYTLRDY